jgi:hypothetical protein
MWTLLVVITVSAVVLGLWSWLAWSLPLAMLLLVRLGGLMALIFFLQGALQASGRVREFCRGAAIGVAFALVQWSSGGAWWTSLWGVLVTMIYALVGGWAAVKTHSWWRRG